MTAGIEAGAAPGVVGIPGVRPQNEKRSSSFVCRGVDHKTGMSNVSAIGCSESGERHQIETTAPTRIDLKFERNWPVTTIRIGAGRRFMERP